MTFCSSLGGLIRTLQFFLALGINLDWAVIGNTAFTGLLLAWVLLRQQEPPRPQAEDVDEEFVRRLEAVVSRMRAELDAR
ncbi:MAG TPA: hypothetical protein VE596_02515 [Gaiellaceae bacterium]|nr:hypothetical protein [Gaiellaceae bacterium]